jgi:hypothetical protein
VLERLVDLLVVLPEQILCLVEETPVPTVDGR